MTQTEEWQVTGLGLSAHRRKPYSSFHPHLQVTGLVSGDYIVSLLTTRRKSYLIHPGIHSITTVFLFFLHLRMLLPNILIYQKRFITLMINLYAQLNLLSMAPPPLPLKIHIAFVSLRVVSLRVFFLIFCTTKNTALPILYMGTSTTKGQM